MKKCVTCHEVKALEDFNLRTAAQDGRQKGCRDCSKAWYQANRERRLEAAGERNRRVRADLASGLAAYLLAHSCVDCGEVDVRVLDFDHRPGEDKVGGVTNLVKAGRPWSLVYAEIRKCDVRCGNCHRKRTLAQSDNWRQRAWFALESESP